MLVEPWALDDRGANIGAWGAAAKKRGVKVSRSKQEQAAWEAVHGAEADPVVFQRDILPHLRDVPLTVMAEAAGLSEQYCSFIRRGIKSPHLRHWSALQNIGSW